MSITAYHFVGTTLRGAAQDAAQSAQAARFNDMMYAHVGKPEDQ